MNDFTRNQFLTLFAYHWHTHTRLFDLAAQLDETSYHEPTGYGQGSLHALFFHMLRTMNSWRRGLETGQRLSPLKIDEFPTYQALQAEFQQEKAAWDNLCAQLTDDLIKGDINLVTRSGDTVVFPRWRVLQHLTLHGMQHHAEIAAILTQKGRSPGDIDFIFFR